MNSKAMKVSKTGDEKRTTIFRRDNNRCVYCGGVFKSEQLTLDHVQPLAKLGDNSAGNLVTACASCNTRKGCRSAWDWLQCNPEERRKFLRFAIHVWPRLRRAVQQAGEGQ